MTYKRTVSILTILAMIICAMALFTTVDTYAAAKHTHKYGAYKVTKKATCTKAGKKVRKCKKCSKTQTVTIPKKGHSYGAWKTTKKATCETKGTKQRTCKTCKAVQKQTIAKTAHKYGEWTVTKQATCESTGTKQRTCKTCNAVQSETIAKTEHQYGGWTVTKQATCVENGIEEKKCTVCGNTVTNTLPATEKHVWATMKFMTVAPTCSAPGREATRCLVCGDEKDVQKLGKLSHEYGDWHVEQNATCVFSGLEIRTCENCMHVETKSIPATGKHVYGELTVDKAPTCTKTGSASRHCEMCGRKTDVTVLEAEGHDYTVKRREAVHSKEVGGTYPGQIKYTCTKCGHTYTETIPAPEHSLITTKTVDATCTERGRVYSKCTVCGQEFFTLTDMPLGHKWGEEPTIDKAPTCTEDGQESIHCQNKGCKAVKEGSVTVLKAEGHHKWGEPVVTKKPTCENKGISTVRCDVCGEEKTEYIASLGGHRYEGEAVVIKEPTCTEYGVMGRRCLNEGCTSVKSATRIEKKGHQWTEIVNVEPTCTTSGYMTRICDSCGTMQKEVEIPAGGGNHNWSGPEKHVRGGGCEPQVVYKECQNDGCSEKEYLTVGVGSGHDWYTVEGSDINYNSPGEAENRGSYVRCRKCGEYQPGCSSLSDWELPKLERRVSSYSYRCVWGVYFTTDTEASEGFNNHLGLKCGSVFETRIVGGSSGYTDNQYTTIAMKAPAAKEGYKFVGWKNASTGEMLDKNPSKDGRYKVAGDVLTVNWKAEDMTFTPVYEKEEAEESVSIGDTVEKTDIAKPEEQEQKETEPAEEDEEQEPADMAMPEKATGEEAAPVTEE